MQTPSNSNLCIWLSWNSKNSAADTCAGTRIYSLNVIINVNINIHMDAEEYVTIIETTTYTQDQSEPTWIQRFSRPDFLLIYGAIALVTILFVITSTAGSNTTWYQQLKKGPVDAWMLRLLWIISIWLSYIALFLLSESRVGIQLSVTALFLISLFLSLGWIALFYYGQNIGLSLWLVGILFLYKFWLFMHIWYIRPVAAIFLIPILLIYIYLMYTVAHLAYLNDVGL